MSTGFEHTPGPWCVHPIFKKYVIVLADADKGIGGAVDPEVEAALCAKTIVMLADASRFPAFQQSRIVSEDEVIANARLIAAAPDLLSSLRMLVSYLRTNEHWPVKSEHMAYLVGAERAITKAEGGA